ncbi:MAG TPA: DUF3106 domain-containing protein [Candidatus Acidoferrum sp.]|nr:DUF3106 domain-containing protein [Candidatus Acidoferrum sp.]
MTRVGRIALWITAVLSAGRLLCAAPTEPVPGSHVFTNSTHAAAVRAHASLPPEPAEGPPPLPTVKSPVAVFRELLAMSPAERQQALTNRTPENKKVIMSKLREYMAMDADRREERLQVTELRWYLQPLLVTPVTNRTEQLASIPLRNRRVIESRLKEWDKLPPEVQNSLLANKDTVVYLTEIENLTPAQRKKILDGMSPARRQKLQAGIEQWNNLPEDERRNVVSRFNQFFDLTPLEKQKALRTLSGPERRQIENTLKTYATLPPDQRARCALAIEKYTSLTLEDRQQFLKNAERWRLLTPRQRQAWRELVNALPPPEPPPLPPDVPPLPPAHPSVHRVPAIATNGN